MITWKSDVHGTHFTAVGLYTLTIDPCNSGYLWYVDDGRNVSRGKADTLDAAKLAAVSSAWTDERNRRPIENGERARVFGNGVPLYTGTVVGRITGGIDGNRYRIACDESGYVDERPEHEVKRA